MPTYTELADRAAEQAVSAIKRAQELTLQAVTPVAKRVEPIAPKATRLPFADRLPTPAEVIEANFAVARKVLSAQRAYALELAKVISPVFGFTAKKPASANSKSKASQ